MSTRIASSMNERADEDKVFVCMACGKTSTTRYGFIEGDKPGEYVSTASSGWDEACMLNCNEVEKKRLVYNDAGTRVVQLADP